MRLSSNEVSVHIRVKHSIFQGFYLCVLSVNDFSDHIKVKHLHLKIALCISQAPGFVPDKKETVKEVNNDLFANDLSKIAKFGF